MSEEVNGFVVVALTRDEARIWLTGVESGARPERIVAPHDQERHHHVREAQHHHGHDTDHDQVKFFESIAATVAALLRASISPIACTACATQL